MTDLAQRPPGTACPRHPHYSVQGGFGLLSVPSFPFLLLNFQCIHEGSCKPSLNAVLMSNSSSTSPSPSPNPSVRSEAQSAHGEDVSNAASPPGPSPITPLVLARQNGARPEGANGITDTETIAASSMVYSSFRSPIQLLHFERFLPTRQELERLEDSRIGPFPIRNIDI